MSGLTLIATTGFGLEAIVGRELAHLGYPDHRITDGRVEFTGTPLAICRANIFLRCSDRVVLKLGEFEAGDFGALFDGTTELPWADILPRNAEFPVSGRSVRSTLHSVPHCQSIVKKAIVENLRRHHRCRTLDETGPRFRIDVSLLRDRATLTIDTSGSGLHQRGYRLTTGPAPLRETLAAALVRLSGWSRDRPFIDPFCGSGTIAIEAAMMGRNFAPGCHRAFDAQAWPIVPQHLWNEAGDEARDLVEPPLDAPLIATDCDDRVLRSARHNAARAGVEADLHIQRRDISELSSQRAHGCVVCNPPWGHRVGDAGRMNELHREISRVFGKLDDWSYCVLSADRHFEREFGRKAAKRRKLYNAKIACTCYQYFGPRPSAAGNKGCSRSIVNHPGCSQHPG